MAQFRVGRNTRDNLARALQREIRALGLIDTGEMYDSVRVSVRSGDELNKININVNVMYYYFFLDEGTIYIAPQDITEKWLASERVKQIMGDVVQEYIAWQFKQYPLLQMAKILNNPKVTLSFFWIDDPYGLPQPKLKL